MNITVFSPSDLASPPAAPGPEALHIWLIPVFESGLTGMDFRHLSEMEQARSARCLRPDDRQRYLVAHAALRRILSSYLGCSPQILTFSANQHGKPYLSFPLDPRSGQLSFSLSHSGEYAALAFSSVSPIGIDIERDRPSIKPLKLARRFFHSREADYLSSLPSHEQRASFLLLWTLREAFLKGLGTGFYTSSDSFSICPDHEPGIFCIQDGDPEYSAWKLLAVDAPAGYFCSIAYRES